MKKLINVLNLEILSATQLLTASMTHELFCKTRGKVNGERFRREFPFKSIPGTSFVYPSGIYRQIETKQSQFETRYEQAMKRVR